jgi:hypothetical protein
MNGTDTPTDVSQTFFFFGLANDPTVGTLQFADATLSIRGLTVANQASATVVGVYLNRQPNGSPDFTIQSAQQVSTPIASVQYIVLTFTNTDSVGSIYCHITTDIVTSSSGSILLNPINNFSPTNNFAPINNNTPTNNFAPINNNTPTNNFAPTFAPTVNAFGASGYSANGYTTFPNSFIFQWGSVTGGIGHDAPFTVVFPTPFLSALYSLNLTVLAGTIKSIIVPEITSSSLTGFSGVLCGGELTATGYEVAFLAIGV